jgi:hypothetical protein
VEEAVPLVEVEAVLLVEVEAVLLVEVEVVLLVEMEGHSGLAWVPQPQLEEMEA